METIWKRFKYLTLLPLILRSRSFLFGNGNTTKDDKHSGQQFFILGSGRNGSTLLALMLNRHDQIFLPPEQYALPYAVISWRVRMTAWSNYCRKHISEYARKNQDWILDEKDYEQVCSYMVELPEPNRRPSTVHYELLKFYAEKLGRKPNVFGDHSPITTVFFDHIHTEFPKAKFLVLVRHPLDVVLSYSSLKQNPASNPSYACWKWNRSIEAYESLVKNGADVKLVKYEDLVVDTVRTLNAVQSFLGVEQRDLNSTELEQGVADPLGTRKYSHHRNLYKPVSSRSVGRWKVELDEKVVKKCVPSLKYNAGKLGYDLN